MHIAKIYTDRRLSLHHNHQRVVAIRDGATREQLPVTAATSLQARTHRASRAETCAEGIIVTAHPNESVMTLRHWSHTR